ncbi:hypothetical protein N181_09780 [Sinorhizobium fredii USDA 205]|uniref:Uncharacterized protein n=1 Tax=Rhizobium fredii TaxID=380 RepID=A0A844AAI4_RHIFR|nr:hypothetical protein [Sinorhizobium fredii]KSV90949.1 hypothetical protein N181_09780 [Sinorhizobium fredii USDA 205]MQX08656.1 hypothetical protein [Sinorhizobium fredii]GEC30523.1 hypothetical protein EFR01_06940 [Sinorhizobium fredii]GLS09720.1 hypothetical protein GCM10007864_33510 [Sinorhizobium fredii]
MTEQHCATLGWAFLHKPTREAFRRSTGENIAPALERYREWVEENLVGKPGNIPEDAEAAA